VAAALRRVHALPAIPGTFSSFRVVDDYHQLARAAGVTSLPANFEALLARLRAVEAACLAAPSVPCPCHNDLLDANFIIEQGSGRLVILDWEYAGMGDRHFDLANLAAQHAFGDEHDRQLLQAYFGTVTPPVWARHKLLKPMSDFREAMWGLVQSGLSTLDFDFDGYAARYFARVSAGFADPRFDDWLTAVA
jgi:thiamine kinase-like enzyme